MGAVRRSGMSASAPWSQANVGLTVRKGLEVRLWLAGSKEELAIAVKKMLAERKVARCKASLRHVLDLVARWDVRFLELFVFQLRVES